MVYYDDLYGGVLEGDGNNGSGGIEDLVGGNGISIGAGTVTALVAAVGYRMELNGGTASVARYMPIESVSGNSVTMLAGHAYKIYATSQAITLNTESIPANSFGLEGHLEIFVAGTGYVVTGTNVVLANALEPDAVNNITARFHDGLCILSVEDHVAGYIVTVNAGTTAGSLYYGLATSTNEYIAVDASLNGSTLDLGGAVTNGEKHVVGNGYTETIVSGGINCTSKTTFANLGMNGVVVSSGTLTLGDVYIPNGATVLLDSGTLAVEKVTGDGGTIDLNGGCIYGAGTTKMNISGCTLANGAGNAGYGGAIRIATSASANLVNCNFVNNSATTGTALFGYSAAFTISSCSFGENQSLAQLFGTARFIDTQLPRNVRGYDTAYTIDGVCTLPYGTLGYSDGSHPTSVTVNSGAIVDLTGNTNATPIAPGGGITFEAGGATILTGATAGVVDAQYSMDNVTLPAGAKLTNTAVVNLGGTRVEVSSGATASASGCTLTSGGVFDRNGGAATVAGTLTLQDCIVSGNTAYLGKGAYIHGGTLVLKDARFASTQDITFRESGGKVEMSGNCTIDIIQKNPDSNESGTVTISSGASINLTSSIAPGGGITIPSGAAININDNDYNAFGGITASSVNSSGYIGGATVTVPDGATCTYTYHSGGQAVTTSATGPATVVVPGDMSYCG